MVVSHYYAARRPHLSDVYATGGLRGPADGIRLARLPGYCSGYVPALWLAHRGGDGGAADAALSVFAGAVLGRIPFTDRPTLVSFIWINEITRTAGVMAGH